MMNQPVANRSLMDISRFWIGNIKGSITAMAIRANCQIMAKRNNIIHEAELKILDIALIPFTVNKFPPGQKQII